MKTGVHVGRGQPFSLIFPLFLQIKADQWEIHSFGARDECEETNPH